MEELAPRSRERIRNQTGSVPPVRLRSDGESSRQPADDACARVSFARPVAPALTQACAPRVVAVCGPSSAAVNASWRAAIIARDLGATLCLLQPQPPPGVLTRGTLSMPELVRDIELRTRVQAVVKPVSDNVLSRAVIESRDAVMLVLPNTRGNPLREWIMGVPAERLIRLCRCAVLVVKRPAFASYRKVIVPIDLHGQARALVDLACAVSRGSPAQVLHVVAAAEAAVPGMSGSHAALLVEREHRGQKAWLEIGRLLAAGRSQRTAYEAAIEFGDPSAVVVARARDPESELVLIGKRQRGLLADYFLGGMTQRVLAEATCDVLVHPFWGPASGGECES